MASEQRKEFAAFRSRLLNGTASKEFICARCGEPSKSIHIHHIEELISGGENNLTNMIPLCGDCHLEWDTCADIGMKFGEFLVSLPCKTWQMSTAIGLFKSTESIGNALKNIYKLQFTGNALKYENKNGYSYWDELKRQNRIFSAYPYSDHEKMIELYGNMYMTVQEDEFERLSKNRLDEYTA